MQSRLLAAALAAGAAVFLLLALGGLARETDVTGATRIAWDQSQQLYAYAPIALALAVGAWRLGARARTASAPRDPPARTALALLAGGCWAMACNVLLQPAFVGGAKHPLLSFAVGTYLLLTGGGTVHYGVPPRWDVLTTVPPAWTLLFAGLSLGGALAWWLALRGRAPAPPTTAGQA